MVSPLFHGKWAGIAHLALEQVPRPISASLVTAEVSLCACVCTIVPGLWETPQLVSLVSLGPRMLHHHVDVNGDGTVHQG